MQNHRLNPAKILLVFLIVLVMSLMAILSVSAEQAQEPYNELLVGDANGDGVVNGKDVTRIRRYIKNYDATTEKSSVEVSRYADVNKNGKVDETDLKLMLNCLSNYHEDSGEKAIKFGLTLIEDSIYHFGDNGILRKNTVIDDLYFGDDGKLVANKLFVNIFENTYYVVNNTIVKNYQVINNNIYYFGEDGVMQKDKEVDGNRFGEDGKLVGDKVFVTVGGNTYYVVNNTVLLNYQVINNNIYYFGEDGVMQKDKDVDGNRFGSDGKLVGDKVFVTAGANTYYVVNNVIVFNYQIINNNIYYFGEDGVMQKDKEVDGNRFGSDGKLAGDKIFVTIEGNTYYVVNNVIVVNYQVINNNIYYFGEDGIMQKDKDVDGNHFGSDGKLVGDKVFVTVGGNTYYVVNNTVLLNYQVINNNIYYFGEDGVMQKDKDVDGNRFGSDGKLVGDKVFVTAGANTYYVVNNVIVFNYQIINNNIYYFGEDGVMQKDKDVDGNHFGSDGKLSGDKIFVTIEGNTYYVVNNVIVVNYQVINNNIYYFGEDGIMQKDKDVDGNHFASDGKLVGDKVFVTVGGNTYYIVNNVIVLNYQIINNNIYYFGEDGVMQKDKDVNGNRFGSDGKLSGDKIFVTVGGNTYYIVNNVIVFNYQIINNNIYYFGNDGIMQKDKEVDGNRFGSDGKLSGDKIFVTIEGNTYYVVNNVIVRNYQIINNNIYYFGNDGVMQKDKDVEGNRFDSDGKLVGDKVFVTVGGNTYYIVNNVIVLNYQIINNNIYYFGEDGVMQKDKDVNGNRFGSDGKLVGDKVFVTVGGNTYYIVNNVIVFNYQIINNNIYYFGNDGIMQKDQEIDGNRFDSDGKLVGSNVFITIQGNTYYVINNVIVFNYQIINNNVYYFGDNGIMIKDCDFNGYHFNSHGYIEVDGQTTIVINNTVYWIIGSEVQLSYAVTGVVYESDNDMDLGNNAKLQGVTCVAEVSGTSFNCTTNADGAFAFEKIPAGTVVLKFSLGGYIMATKTIVLNGDTSVAIVMDKEVSNTLTGKITVADADTNYSNNTPLANALITLTRTTSTNEWSYNATTNANGIYSFTGLTAGVYSLTVSCDGYFPVTQTVNVRYNETTIQNLVIEAIPATQVAPGSASGNVIDAKTGYTISGITVKIREGLNNLNGDIIATAQTNASGVYTVTDLAPGNYTAEFVDERSLTNEDYRYGSVGIAIKVLSGTTISNQNVTLSNSVGINADSMRIVLSWGSTPRDLDSHLLASISGSSYHVYYSNKRPHSSMNLDVDDTSSYGPETVTVTTINPGVYHYYVHDYTNGSSYSSTALANSGAQVAVYFGNSATPAYVFNVPAGSGTYWDIFTYNSVTGEFTIINRVSTSIS